MSPATTDKAFTFTDPDGFVIAARRWAPPASIATKAAVQIAHGAAEHMRRYERFARFLNQAGYVVYADDHRGHGETAGSLERAGHVGADGWNGMVRDLKQLSDLIRAELPGLPLFFFGHSMGSLLAQRYVELWGEDLQGLILSGTFGSLAGLEHVLAMVEPLGQGPDADQPSETFAAMFAGFNASFGGETGFEWLSRDPVEVRKYADDPFCGFPFPNRLVALMLRGAHEIWKPENETRIPRRLPVYFISGDRDPAGGAELESARALVGRYRGLGLHDVEVSFYPEARHELLNETNRDEVQRDVLRWLDRHL